MVTDYWLGMGTVLMCMKKGADQDVKVERRLLKEKRVGERENEGRKKNLVTGYWLGMGTVLRNDLDGEGGKRRE